MCPCHTQSISADGPACRGLSIGCGCQKWVPKMEPLILTQILQACKSQKSTGPMTSTTLTLASDRSEGCIFGTPGLAATACLPHDKQEAPIVKAKQLHEASADTRRLGRPETQSPQGEVDHFGFSANKKRTKTNTWLPPVQARLKPSKIEEKNTSSNKDLCLVL